MLYDSDERAVRFPLTQQRSPRPNLQLLTWTESWNKQGQGPDAQPEDRQNRTAQYGKKEKKKKTQEEQERAAFFFFFTEGHRNQTLLLWRMKNPLFLQRPP